VITACSWMAWLLEVVVAWWNKVLAVDAPTVRPDVVDVSVGPKTLTASHTPSPTSTPATTFTRAQLAEEPVAHNRALGRFTQFTNLLDLAAVAVPVGTTTDGRPFGVTLFGPAFSEDRLISAASDLFREAV